MGAVFAYMLFCRTAGAIHVIANAEPDPFWVSMAHQQTTQQ